MSKTLVLLGYDDAASPRTWTVRRHFEREGWIVRECRTEARGFLKKLLDLRRRWKRVRREADAVLVTFPGHYLMPFAWLLTRLPSKTPSQTPSVVEGSGVGGRKPLFFDAFISLSDSIVDDRRLVSWRHPYAWFLFLVDAMSCRLADRIYLDTEAHRQFFLRRFGLRPERVAVIPLQARPDLFAPRAAPLPPHPVFNVFFYGTYIPLQGVAHILRAASIVGNAEPNVHFTLVGGGQQAEEMRRLAEELKLRNVTFVPFAPLAELPRMLRNADLALGIFGTTDKAARVVPHKVIDAVACGVPVLTRDSPAIRERYADHPGVLLCPPGDPAAIARVILARSACSSNSTAEHATSIATNPKS